MVLYNLGDMAINFLFDLFAPFYDKVIGKRDANVILEHLDLPDAKWLLDAGGGTGRVSEELVSSVEHLVICDLSYPMLEEAKGKNVFKLVQGETGDLPFDDAVFDRIMVVDALHHFSNPKSVLADLLRVLKKDGIMLIEEPDIQFFSVKVLAIIEKLALMKSQFLSPGNIKKLVESFGGEAEIKGDGKFAAWVIVRKKD